MTDASGRPWQVDDDDLGADSLDELGVAVPEGWHDRCWQAVGSAEPVDPAVEFHPLDLGFLGGEEVPIDRVRGLRG